ncbi:Glycerophosphodiester phosphodiesterase GDPD4 [Zea mays]|uniref:Glycerophosphodiester phosphodiesterase GDPD4 n=1 Tax=Zea mays TaxID=4577 RepID=A0A1D6QSE6_MAIZE|nr:Glycerophosphodiester phosphodiesterase GDPD4 [Zea mays]
MQERQYCPVLYLRSCVKHPSFFSKRLTILPNQNAFKLCNSKKLEKDWHPLIHEKVMKVMHRHDRRVFAWTVHDISSMKKMLYEHVDAIMTSNSSLLQRLMQETRAEYMEDGFILP